MPSYNVLRNVNDFLDQLTRLVVKGYYFYYEFELGPNKDPEKTQQRIIDTWGLEIPYWERAKRRRGNLPSIWLLRYKRRFVVLSTHGETKDEEPHPFFIENEERLLDIRKYALCFCGYSIRYPISQETGKRKLFIRLDRDTYLNLKAELCRDGIRERYRDREAIESVFKSLPWQPYEQVYIQLQIILKAVNKARKYRGYDALRKGCVRTRRRTPSRLSRHDESERNAGRLQVSSVENIEPSSASAAG